MSDPTAGERACACGHGAEAHGLDGCATCWGCGWHGATPDAGDASEPLSAEAYYMEHGWSGCAGSRWFTLSEATKDGWRAASREAAAATRARAEALREAADEMPFGYSHAAHLLRARADSLTPDTPARTIPTTATVRDGLAADTAADNRVRWNRALKGGA